MHSNIDQRSIFEWEESEEDMLRLIIGPIPDSNKSIVSNSSAPSIPATRYYAVLLAELAHERGFDGYLLNVECNLRGGSEQTRALCVWISFLESELKRRVGQHSRVVWSVIAFRRYMVMTNLDMR